MAPNGTVAVLLLLRQEAFTSSRGPALVRADPATGAWQVVGNGDESLGSNCMAALGDNLYIIQGAALCKAKTHPPSGSQSWAFVGHGDEWLGSSCMAALGDNLYIVQGAALCQALTDPPPDSQSWALVGHGDEWLGSNCMAALGDYLYIVQGATLCQAMTDPPPDSQSWARVGNGTEWAGSTDIAARGPFLYFLQGPQLVRVDPTSGQPNVIADGPAWAGAKCMTIIDDAAYVIFQDAASQASWNQHLQQVQNLLPGPLGFISTEDQNAIRDILLNSESAAELQFYINSIGWALLAFKVTPARADEIASRLASLLDVRGYHYFGRKMEGGGFSNRRIGDS
jgi:hypothetical protein